MLILYEAILGPWLPTCPLSCFLSLFSSRAGTSLSFSQHLREYQGHNGNSNLCSLTSQLTFSIPSHLCYSGSFQGLPNRKQLPPSNLRWTVGLAPFRLSSKWVNSAGWGHLRLQSPSFHPLGWQVFGGPSEGLEIGQLSTRGTRHCSHLSLTSTEQTPAMSSAGWDGRQWGTRAAVSGPPWLPLGLGSVSILLWSSLTFSFCVPGSAPLNASQIWNIFSFMGQLRDNENQFLFVLLTPKCPKPGNPFATC